MMIGALVFLGCPLRMLIRMSAGDLNAYVGLIGFAGGIRDLALLKDASLISVLGGLFVVMLIGAAVAHNFGLASAAAKAATETEEALAGGPGIYGKVAVILCIIVLFIIACTQKRRTAK